MRIEALCPLKINRPDGDALHLHPGCPVDVSDELGSRILQRLPDKVRLAEPSCIEPAMKPDGSPLSAFYWESGDGRILGPAIPEFLARSGKQFWIVTTLEGLARWINADQLRSKRQWAGQKPVIEVDRLLKA